MTTQNHDRPGLDFNREAAMKLLPDEIRNTLPRLYSEEKNRDPIVHVKFFTPDAGWTWYVTEGQEEDGDFRFFGFVQGFVGEWGYWLLSEISTARGPLGLPIERDLYFKPKPFSEVRGE